MKRRIQFNATTVACSEAIDFEIQQVIFDAESSDFDDYDDTRRTPYLLIGVNFEFPGPPTVEWHDGEDYSGGSGIKEVSRTRNQIIFFAGDEIEFDITFEISEDAFRELTDYLDRIIHGRLRN